MGTPELLKLARGLVKEQFEEGLRPVAVVSAFKGITDAMFSILYNLREQFKDNGNRKYQEEIINLFMKETKEKHLNMIEYAGIPKAQAEQLTPKTLNILKDIEDDLEVTSKFGVLDVFRDKILSYGEKLSSLFFVYFLEAEGIFARRFTGEDIGIITDSVFLDANIDYEISAQNVKSAIGGLNGEVPVVTGFIGKNKDGQTTTLGRGGSDTTACFLGAALNAEKVILWKEVDGVLSADPKIVPTAKTVKYVSYAEAEESGKVICDKAIQYLKQSKVKSEVSSINDPLQKTEVGPKREDGNGVKIISSKKNLTLLVVTDDGVKEYGFLYQIARVFYDHKVNMAFIRNTRDSLYIVVENGNGKDLEKSIDILKQKNFKMEIEQAAMVTVIGNLDWSAVNQFNDTLLKLSPCARLGGFPYKNCVRLEAIVKPDEIKKIIQGFHKEFIN